MANTTNMAPAFQTGADPFAAVSALLGSSPSYQAAGKAKEQMAVSNLQQDTRELEALKAKYPTPPAEKAAAEFKAESDKEPQVPRSDPLKAFGSWATALGILFGAMTRRPLTNALTAAAGAMSAVRENDIQRYQMELDRWQKHMTMVQHQADLEVKAYDQAWNQAKTDVDLRAANLRTVAAIFGDRVTEHNIAMGDWEKVQQVQMARQRLSLETDRVHQETAALAQTQALNLAEAPDAWSKFQATLPDTDTRRNLNWDQLTAAAKQPGPGGEPARQIVAAMQAKSAEDRKVRQQKELYDMRGTGWALYQDAAGTNYRRSPSGDVIQKRTPDGRWEDTQAIPQGASIMGKNAMGGAVPGTNMTPETLDTNAITWLTTRQLPYSKWRGAAENTAIMNRATELARETGLSVEEMAALAPEKKADASALLKDVAWADGIKRAQGTMEGMFPVAKEYLDKLDLTSIRSFNDMLLAAKTEFGDADANNFQNAMTTIATEYGRLQAGPMSAAMLPVQMMDVGMKRLQSVTPSQFLGEMELMRKEAKNAYDQQEKVVEDRRRSLRSIGRSDRPADTSPPGLPAGWSVKEVK